MTLDAHLPQNPVTKSAAAQPLWATLTRWWSPASHAAADTELGYESALPWTLGEQAPAETAGPPHY